MQFKPIVLPDKETLFVAVTTLRAMRFQVITAAQSSKVLALPSEELAQITDYFDRIKTTCNLMLLNIAENNKLRFKDERIFYQDPVQLYQVDLGNVTEWETMQVFYRPESSYQVCNDFSAAQTIVAMLDLLDAQIGMCSNCIRAAKPAKKTMLNFLKPLGALYDDAASLRMAIYFDHPGLITTPFWKKRIKKLRAQLASDSFWS
jgi:hypothetical protein